MRIAPIIARAVYKSQSGIGRLSADLIRKKPYPTRMDEKINVMITGTKYLTGIQYKVFYLVVKRFKIFMNY